MHFTTDGTRKTFKKNKNKETNKNTNNHEKRTITIRKKEPQQQKQHDSLLGFVGFPPFTCTLKP